MGRDAKAAGGDIPGDTVSKGSQPTRGAVATHPPAAAKPGPPSEQGKHSERCEVCSGAQEEPDLCPDGRSIRALEARAEKAEALMHWPTGSLSMDEIEGRIKRARAALRSKP